MFRTEQTERDKIAQKGLKKITARSLLENRNVQLLGKVQVLENSQAETMQYLNRDPELMKKLIWLIIPWEVLFYILPVIILSKLA